MVRDPGGVGEQARAMVVCGKIQVAALTLLFFSLDSVLGAILSNNCHNDVRGLDFYPAIPYPQYPDECHGKHYIVFFMFIIIKS